jgi:hypothetical protein
MPLKHILKNKLMLQKHFHLQEYSIDSWSFWMFEENIKIVNEIVEQEEKNQGKQEQQQSSNFDANSMMKNAQSMTNNIPKPKY